MARLLVVLVALSPISTARTHAGAARLDLRPDQHVYWFGQELSSPVFMSAQGESVAVNDLPDLGSVRGRQFSDQAQVHKLAGAPLVRQLQAQGLAPSMILAYLDSAITRSAERIVYAYHNALRTHRDPAEEVRLAADTLIVDMSHAPVVRRELVLMTVRGVGRASMAVSPATVNVLGAPHRARLIQPTTEPPAERIGRLRGILARRGIQLVIVSQGGDAVLTGALAIRGLAEIDSVRRLRIPAVQLQHSIISRAALEQIQVRSKRGH